MEDPIAHDETNSRSASEKSASDTDQKKRVSGSTASSKSNHSQENSTTPTANPPSASQQTSAMAPPPKPIFKATPTSAQPLQPISQGSSQETFRQQSGASAEATKNGNRTSAVSSQHPASNTAHATPRKRSHVEVDQQQTADDQDTSDEDAEPADRIASFDWMQLETRYHQQLERFSAEEQDLYRSFSDLCGYFYVWAESGHHHEVERSFKRMKTQITLVQHNEEVLEGKRQHYVKVVEAFKSALQLLGSD